MMEGSEQEDLERCISKQCPVTTYARAPVSWRKSPSQRIAVLVLPSTFSRYECSTMVCGLLDIVWLSCPDRDFSLGRQRSGFDDSDYGVCMGRAVGKKETLKV